MYEVLAYWDDPPALDEQPFFVQEFAEIWQAADKSSTPGHSRRRAVRISSIAWS